MCLQMGERLMWLQRMNPINFFAASGFKNIVVLNHKDTKVQRLHEVSFVFLSAFMTSWFKFKWIHCQFFVTKKY